MRLKRSFFERNSTVVAKNLLGKILVRIINDQRVSGIIVETEAYRGDKDPGSHAYKKITDRNKIMFGPPGVAYVYLCYGNHYLLNIVTEKEGFPGAVLIRALEPYENIKLMKILRKVDDEYKLTNGPGKLTEALAIGRKENGLDVVNSKNLFIEDLKDRKKFKIISTSRVGIKQGLDKKWRFYIEGNKYVSVI
ncbi:MAG: DNA-3-methyladenine glycosylase [Candidatus Goldbacteria bacterium]|nr:DNA-3-methyladenine glycosylase [Candidatus Goldiibacteriota bacterium]